MKSYWITSKPCHPVPLCQSPITADVVSVEKQEFSWVDQVRRWNFGSLIGGLAHLVAVIIDQNGCG